MDSQWRPGCVLDVDVSRNTCTFHQIDPELSFFVGGGRGYNVWRLLQELDPDIDPLGPENIFILSTGLLAAAPIPAATRVHVSALSPQTGILGSSNLGGDFGLNLRALGIQSLILRGRAKSPVFLEVSARGAELHPARGLWGLDTWETESRLQKTLDPRARVVCIGPAGENRVPFACLVSERDHVAGRTGMGAVLGSKLVKAIALQPRVGQVGKGSAREKKAVRTYLRAVSSDPEYKTLAEYGGAGYIRWCHDAGLLSTRNYRQNRFEAVDSIDGRQLRSFRSRKKGCFRCPVRCKADLEGPETGNTGATVVRPEFESMVNLGSRCGLAELWSLVDMDNICTRLGMDTISTGGVLAFAMDLYARGLIGAEDTGGQELKWGDAPLMRTLIRDIAAKRGLGAVLALGTREAALHFGSQAHKWAAQVKGLDISAYVPDQAKGTALGYAVSSRGGDFNTLYANMEYRWSRQRGAQEFGQPESVNRFSPHGKAPLIRRSLLVNCVLDSLGLCKVPLLSLIGDFDLGHEAELTRAVTRTPLRARHLFTLGERVAVLERMFNLKCGVIPEDDDLPPMFWADTASEEADEESGRSWVAPMRQAFYACMGWDDRGRPTQETLDQLGLEQTETAQPIDPQVARVSPAEDRHAEQTYRIDAE